MVVFSLTTRGRGWWLDRRIAMAEQAGASSRADRTLQEAPPRGERPRAQQHIRIRLAAALAAGALVTVSIGLLERHMATSPHPISYFHLFFSDPLYMKAWLASAALVLSFGQLVTAAGMYGALRISPATR